MNSPTTPDSPERAVVVITAEHMAAHYKELEENPPNLRGPEGNYLCPISDESVQGYLEDITPLHSGVQEMLTVVDIMKHHGIPCCMVAEAALIYYGTGRLMFEWRICVTTDRLEDAAQLFRTRSENFEPFRPTAMTRFEQINHLFPRFKFTGLRLFFSLISSQGCHLHFTPENIEYSHTGLPYPKLPIFAQSLLDTRDWVDLDDLIDGMNLTLDWGIENLNLEGTIDGQWGRWKADLLYGDDGNADDGMVPRRCAKPDSRLDAWKQMVSDEAKKARQGFKYLPSYETRFWKRGQKDPRLWKRPHC